MSATAPATLQVIADPHRWRLLGELARSDRRVGELVELVGEPQSLVSYHLRTLRDAGLVASRRSSYDGRDVYYRVDLDRCGDVLAAAGAELAPGLQLRREPVPAVRRRRRRRVLFLCTGNSARSQMAEALLAHRSAGTMEARSAGSHPKELHPNAVRAMRARGIDISGHRTKHLDQFAGARFDAVVTLCDKVREVCPELARAPAPVHWSLPDPSAAGATDAASYPAFEHVARDLEPRIDHLIARLAIPGGGTTHVR